MDRRQDDAFPLMIEVDEMIRITEMVNILPNRNILRLLNREDLNDIAKQSEFRNFITKVNREVYRCYDFCIKEIFKSADFESEYGDTTMFKIRIRKFGKEDKELSKLFLPVNLTQVMYLKDIGGVLCMSGNRINLTVKDKLEPDVSIIPLVFLKCKDFSELNKLVTEFTKRLVGVVLTGDIMKLGDDISAKKKELESLENKRDKIDKDIYHKFLSKYFSDTGK